MAESKRRREKTAGKLSPKHVLVPIDFLAASEKALRQALSLAGKASRITLLHVISPALGIDQQISARVADANRRLTAFREKSGDGFDQSIDILVRTGVPFQEILKVAEEDNVEMIVLGVNDSGPLAGIELGRTIERVSRYARCPVLLARQSE